MLFKNGRLKKFRAIKLNLAMIFKSNFDFDTVFDCYVSFACKFIGEVLIWWGIKLVHKLFV